MAAISTNLPLFIMMYEKKVFQHIKNVLTLRRTAVLLLAGILFLTFWIRVQGVERLPDGQFTDTDGYFYYKQAKIISEQGSLPERDMQRWVPLGRDLNQLLSVYPYVLAYTYKAISLCFSKVALYHICLYAPTVCFTLGLGVLCLFLYSAFGSLFSSIVGVLLATLPGAIERSASGFGDRDSWCLMVGILAVTTYLVALRSEHPRHKFFFTLASGLSVFLGGLSWEGFGVFLIVIYAVELWRFLTSEKEGGLRYYLLWVCTFVPTLYLASAAYRNGQGFATHLFTFVLVPPIVLLAIRVLRHHLITKPPFIYSLKPHARILALVLTGVSLVISFGVVSNRLGSFDSTTVPFSQSRLMQTVGELQSPDYSYWYFQYGGVFVLGALGFICAALHIQKRGRFLFAIPLILFILTTFFREPIDRFYVFLVENVGEAHWLAPFFTNSVFFIAIAGVVLGFLILAWQYKDHKPNDIIFVAASTWFLCWVALARDALRYDFFICVPLAFFAAALIQTLSNTLSEKLKHFRYVPDVFKRNIPQALLKSSLACILLALLLFWPPVGAHTNLSLYAAGEMRNPLPGDSALADAINWMQIALSDNTVVAANWEYGNQLNVLGGVKTVTDPDHYLPNWIHLYFRHVYAAQSEIEALEFLKTHEVTHLLFTKVDLLHTRKYSAIGSDANNDRGFKAIPLRFLKTESGKPNRLFNSKETPFYYIDVVFDKTTPLVLTARFKDQTVRLPYVAFKGIHRYTSSLNIYTSEKHGGVVLYFDSKEHLRKAYFFSPIGWNSLAIRLYLRAEHSDAFVPVYPQQRIPFADVTVWEIHYPSDINRVDKYLATEPKNKRAR